MKNRLLLLSLIFTIFSGFLHAQQWGRNTESAFTNEANALVVDQNGNSYIAGYITGETAFEVGVVQPYAPGNGDIYIAKYNSTGSLIWVKQFGGNNSDKAIDLAVDQSGFIYVTGQFFGSVNFDGTIVQASGASKDIFLIKMNPSGDVIWAVAEGATGEENAYGIATDNQNNVLLTGQYTGNSSIGGQNFVSMMNPVTNLPSSDLFISKYDSNGNPLWVKTGVAEYEDRGMDIACDDQNNIVLIGQFSDTLNFGGQIINNGGYNVGFITKLNPAGQTQWFRSIKAGMVVPYAVAINISNEIVLTGDFLGNLQYTDANGTSTLSNTYYRKIFVMKTNSNGNYTWGTTLGSNNDLSARSIAINSGKDIFVTGHFICDLSELHDPQPFLWNSVGFKDLYLWHISDQGNSVYIKQAGSKRDDQGKGIAILNNKPILCGSYTSDLNIMKDAVSSYQWNNNNDFNLNNYSTYPSHLYLHGDESRNSFLTYAITPLSAVYDYFNPQGIDSLESNIVPNQDTVDFCVSKILHMSANTYGHLGPQYTYLWSTGSTLSTDTIYSGGWYSVELNRIDGCSSNTDSIFAILHTPPPLPLMTDSLGIAINEPGLSYQNYHFCSPVAIPIWFHDLDSGLTISIQGLGTSHYDTLVHTYSNEGLYHVIVSDPYCSAQGTFSINLDYVTPPSINPYLILYDTLDYNDSITVCDNQYVKVLLRDSLNNPNGAFNIPINDQVVSYSWSVQPACQIIYQNNQTDSITLTLNPNTTGWYTVTYNGSFGYDNLCGVDTLNFILVDSFYIEVLPLPSVSITISGDNLLCPNGSVYLSIPFAVPGLAWFGPGINWTSLSGDSVQVTAAGLYHYKGWLVDTITGCSKWHDFTFELIEKSPPNILSNPSDAIICPYDSVLMWVDSIYLDYVWFGPNGDSLSLTSTHTDDEQGFYYVTVLDSENCYLTSPPYEIREYSTPFLTVEPTNILCGNNSITISAIFDGNGQVNWLSPVVSNASQLIVTEGGWYVCELLQCGVTILDSVYIIDGTFTANLTVSDTLLCFGEDAFVSAPPGMSNYEWNTGDMGISFLQTSQQGFYYATLTNAYGCEAQTDTVFIEFIENSVPPSIADMSICAGSSLTISNNQITEWYSTDSVFISSDYGLFVPAINQDTAFLAAYATAECPLAFTEINISVIDSIPQYPLSLPTGLCLNDSLSISIPANGESVEWYNGGQLIGSGNQLSVYGGDLVDNQLVVEVSNSCFTYTTSSTLNLIIPAAISLTSDTLLTCPEGLLTLSLPLILSSTQWSGYFGQSDSVTLNLPHEVIEGYVYVTGIDTNGCQSNMDSIWIDVNSLQIQINDNMLLNCEGDIVSLSANVYGSSFYWNGPTGISSDSLILIQVQTSTEGWYSIVVEDTLGCNYSDSVYIDYHPLPTISLPEDTMLCMRSYLGGSIWVDSLIFTWSGYGIQDSIIMMQDGLYYLTVVDAHGCVYKDSIEVDVVNCDDALPNVFTPNNDGVNDFFIIDEALLFPNNTLMLFNRWGNEVYRQDGYDNTFDGEELTEGTYYYVFYREGIEKEGGRYEGYVTIIR